MKKLYLDDLRVTPEGFDRVYNYTDFVEYITQNGLPNFISFDHDLGEDESGYDCAKSTAPKILRSQPKSRRQRKYRKITK